MKFISVQIWSGYIKNMFQSKKFVANLHLFPRAVVLIDILILRSD